MKKFLIQPPLPWMASLAAVLLSAISTLTVAAQTSPVGLIWDVTLSGDQRGVAQLIFNPDYTIDGTEVITVKPKAKTDSDDDSRPGLPGGIRVDGPSTNGVSTNVYFYGTTLISGTWTLDSSGRLFGVLVEGGEDLINGISFKGKRKGSRLTLTGRHERRTIHYRGQPQTPLADISGRFLSNGQRDGEPTVEVFELEPDFGSPFANQYLVTGSGPAYSIEGIALLSGQNQLAIANLQTLGTNVVLSAVSGSYKITKGRGSLNGVDEKHKRVTARIEKLVD